MNHVTKNRFLIIIECCHRIKFEGGKALIELGNSNIDFEKQDSRD